MLVCIILLLLWFAWIGYIMGLSKGRRENATLALGALRRVESAAAWIEQNIGDGNDRPAWDALIRDVRTTTKGLVLNWDYPSMGTLK